jgi:hypothetical protein
MPNLMPCSSGLKVAEEPHSSRRSAAVHRLELQLEVVPCSLEWKLSLVWGRSAVMQPHNSAELAVLVEHNWALV